MSDRPDNEPATDQDRKLSNPPIVEAVVDIDCVMLPSLKIAALEAPARAALTERYPRFRTVHLEELLIETPEGAPPRHSARRGIQAFQFWQEDERQLVQVRGQGFSFNRLAPYTGLDDYLPEIERCWRLFVGVAAPIQIRAIQLRYINRMLLPMQDGKVELDDYLKRGPRLPDETRLVFAGFVDQHVAVEPHTGNQVTIILTSQPMEEHWLPVIFDIQASRAESAEPEDWGAILGSIQSLRDLKNLVFRNTLTSACMELFE